ncbi:uracil permease [Anaerobranca californiensis DSM 14826]|jgi:uracil permease|uniref:Uracil permease n=1 Tax=Anaerobranca californiensis DSM 14826 TaxID=1120989 RepID=A0A1M6KS26_9FIRM|nr:solute carrier family 23 protein [Anaerobranca californiensis]SHJ61694.1 uracil permease [Anaerobranca californiensis DSM 14826]
MVRKTNLSVLQIIPLSFQHVFAMFGATILVPYLTGLDPLVALFTSGLGTILFTIVTKGKVPAYLGSSFAFIPPLIYVVSNYSVPIAMGGVVVAGLIYLLFSVMIKYLGVDIIKKAVPPVVVGPVIISIGLSLAGVAGDMASANLPIAFITLAIVIIFTMFGRGMFKVVPILMGIVGGYLISLALHLFTDISVFDPQRLAEFSEASWMPAIPNFVMPQFNPSAILLIAPIAVVTLVEHLGDILAISKTVDEDFISDPGLHRTIAGDGIATLCAGIGGPPNTTYGENIGVLAITKVKDPIVVQVAACIVLMLSFIPKFGALIATIPVAVMGGIVVLLFGMISSVGIRTLVDDKIDLTNTRNLIIVSTILIFSLSGIGINIYKFTFEGIGLGAIIGIILNGILPEKIGV